MKVHLITSRPSLSKDYETIKRIAMAITESGHNLASDWIEKAHDRNVRAENYKADWNAIFKTNVETVAQTDVVIAEGTHDSFAVGYQVALAIQQKKPVLLLRHSSVEDDVFAAGVEDGWVLHGKYTTESLSSLVKKFLDDNDIKSKDMRFNFFIDRKIHNYLRWAALRTGKTKAEILRDLVEKEIDRENGTSA